MKAKLQLPAAQSGEWIQPAMTGFLLQCCDCGLTHRLDFQIGTKPDGTPGIRFRASRVAPGRTRRKVPV